MLSRESKSDETCRLRLEEKFRLFFSVCFILIFFPDKQDFPKSWTVWLDRLNFCRWNSKDTVDKKFQNSRVSNLTKSNVQETPGKVTYPWWSARLHSLMLLQQSSSWAFHYRIQINCFCVEDTWWMLWFVRGGFVFIALFILENDSLGTRAWIIDLKKIISLIV